jgi:hypothetical protein
MAVMAGFFHPAVGSFCRQFQDFGQYKTPGANDTPGVLFPYKVVKLCQSVNKGVE